MSFRVKTAATFAIFAIVSYAYPAGAKVEVINDAGPIK
jgi:hypothetical protein